MNRYVVGTLEKNEPGAIFEGHIWDRNLEFRASDGTVITIFDFDNISEELKVGQTYHLVISLMAFPLKYSRAEIVDVSPETWSGEIMDLAWDSTKESFQYHTPKIHNRLNQVLVHCRIGNVITSLSTDKYQMMQIGNVVYWESCRWDLYGVLANDKL